MSSLPIQHSACRYRPWEAGYEITSASQWAHDFIRWCIDYGWCSTSELLQPLLWHPIRKKCLVISSSIKKRQPLYLYGTNILLYRTTLTSQWASSCTSTELSSYRVGTILQEQAVLFPLKPPYYRKWHPHGAVRYESPYMTYDDCMLTCNLDGKVEITFLQELVGAKPNLNWSQFLRMT